jgi:hypothetical protein
MRQHLPALTLQGAISMDIYSNTPYTYRIQWTKTGMNYYGVRYAKDCDPSDLFVTYFTSSEYVTNYIKEHGMPDIIEVRQTFTTHSRINEARDWESRVLTKLNVTKNKNYLNKSTGKAIPPMYGEDNPMNDPISKEKFLSVVRSVEHRYNQGIPVRQRVADGTHHFLGEGVNKKRVNDGTHQFLGGKIQSKSSRARVENGTHNFFGATKQQLLDGTHPSQVKWTCEYCGKEGNGSTNYKRWHGINCRVHQDKK